MSKNLKKKAIRGVGLGGGGFACDLECVGEAAEADELLDDGLDDELLDGMAFLIPLLEDGG